MKIALLANLKENAPTWFDMSSEAWSHLVSWKTIQTIIIALEKIGHSVTFLEGDQTLYNNLLAVKPDICFNICQGHFGEAKQAQVPAILEMLGIPYTGPGLLTLSLTSDQAMTKRILAYHRLPTPAFQEFERADEPLEAGLGLPLCLKSGQPEVIIHEEGELRRRLEHILERDNRPALVEEVTEGPTVKIGIIGNLRAPVARRTPDDREGPRVFRGLHIFPPAVVNDAFDLAEVISSKVNSVKISDGFQGCRSVRLEQGRIENLNGLAAAAFRVIGCRDVAQVIFRLDSNRNHEPYILDIDPLPSLDPYQADLCFGATSDEWRYEDLLNRILTAAVQRYQLEAQPGYRPLLNYGW